MTKTTSLKNINAGKGVAALFGGAAAFLMTLGGAVAAPGVDGYTWSAIDTGSTGTFLSISAVGDYAVASTAGNSIFEYRDGVWSANTDWTAYSAANSPFGTGGTAGDRNTIRVAALSENEFWIVSYVSQANYVRYRDGSFSTFNSGTGQRSAGITAFGSYLLIGRGNGAFARIAVNPETGAVDHRRDTKQENAVGVISRVTGSGPQNMWMGTSSRLFHSTNGNASVITWTELTRPEALDGTIGAMGAWQEAVESTTTYYNFLAIGQSGDTSLFLWNSVDGFDETPLFTLTGSDAFTVNSLYVRDSENIWLAGTGGNLWYWDGETASKIDLGITTTLNAISGTDEGIWVAGAGGQVFTTLAPIPEPGTLALLGVAGMTLFGAGRRMRKSRR